MVQIVIFYIIFTERGGMGWRKREESGWMCDGMCACDKENCVILDSELTGITQTIYLWWSSALSYVS